jgi:hypothetical protein
MALFITWMVVTLALLIWYLVALPTRASVERFSWYDRSLAQVPWVTRERVDGAAFDAYARSRLPGKLIIALVLVTVAGAKFYAVWAVMGQDLPPEAQKFANVRAILSLFQTMAIFVLVWLIEVSRPSAEHARRYTRRDVFWSVLPFADKWARVDATCFALHRTLRTWLALLFFGLVLFAGMNYVLGERMQRELRTPERFEFD